MTTTDQAYQAAVAQAEQRARLCMSPRYLRLDALERWVDGTQYKGRPSWFDGGPTEVPLWEREPCIVYPLVSIAISSNCDLCLGEGKFPAFKVAHSGKGTAATEGENQTDPVEECLGHIHRMSRFQSFVRDAYRDAQGCGTAVAIFGARDGRPFQDLVPAKWCDREIGQHGEVTKLVIEYPYLDEYQMPDGSWAVRVMVYRRVIDQTRDVEFKPFNASAGTRPNWAEARSVSHGFNFCPVVWYAFMRGCQPVNVIDGKAIHRLLTDEIQAHDIARSQWHRGALYSEPQIYEIGVNAEHNPTGEGRTAMVPSTEHGGPVAADNPIVGQYREDFASGARKKGPNVVWRYPSKDTKVGAIEYAPGALKAQQDNCSDLKTKLQEALCVVLLDPENIKTASMTSGKALEAIRQKQLDRIDEHRDDLRDGFIVPSVVMQIKILRKLGPGLKVPGVAEAVKALGPDAAAADPDIEVRWGSYSKPDPAEQLAIIRMVKEALKDTPVITLRAAVEKVAPIFGVEDVDRLMLELEKEREERAAKMQSELRLMRDEPDGAVSSDTPGAPASGNRGRPEDGQDDAGQAGD